ncbi:MAG: rhomboid family intramembrane serine protease [Akkermansiaceae bacterium]|nr:rhomboid family intramembrane serine protease [Akkermansiaceae bacterium]MCF7730979.1 rhomboid family intramembrane serine protease [Akkermansiaceae bacterium]
MTSPLPNHDSPPLHPLARALWVVGGLLVLMWGVELVDWLGGSWLELDRHGIRPRRMDGLLGIALSPFLHAGWGHLVANSVPFFILGLLVMGRGEPVFWMVSAGIVLLGGFGVWLIGRAGTVHVGASGLIFGYFGYLVTVGVVERSVVAVARSLLIALLYGSILWGLLPNRSGISWEGHLCGLLAGIALAWTFRGKKVMT